MKERNLAMKIRLRITVGLVAILATMPLAAQPQPSDFEYLGAFRTPVDWGQRGLSIADDGAALWIDAHDQNAKVTKIAIPSDDKLVVTKTFGDLYRAQTLVPSYDFIARCPESHSWWLSGLEEVDGVIRGTCAYWYNVGGNYLTEYHSDGGAGQKIGSNAVRFHSNKIGTYLFELPPDAVSYLGLGQKRLCTGFVNEAGAFHGSQGPPMICFDPDNPSDAKDVFWYRENPPTDPPSGAYTCAGPNAPGVGNCDLPNYVACDQFNGADWISGPTGDAVIIAGRKYFGSNTYITGQGYACSPGFPEFTFYSPADMKDRLDGNREPWEVLPYASWRPDERYQDQSEFGGLAFDPGTGRMYVVEKLGAGGNAVVHVWKLGDGGEPPPPPAPYCGDGFCNGNETPYTCPADCGDPPPPPAPEIGCDPMDAATGNVIAVDPSQSDQLDELIGGAQDGDTFLLADGTYTPTANMIFTAPNVTVRSASGDPTAVIIDPNYNPGAAEVFYVDAANITIAELTIKRVYYHPIHVVSGGDFLTVYRVLIEDGREQFLKVNPTDAGSYADHGTVRCSVFRMTDAGRSHVENGCYTGGIDAHAAQGWKVQDNQFDGIWCDDGLAEHAVHFWSQSRDTLVERNIVTDNARGIGFGLTPGESNVPVRVYADDPLAGSGLTTDDVSHIGGVIRNNFVSGEVAAFDTGIGLEAAFEAEVLHNSVYTDNDYDLEIDVRFPGSKGVIVAQNLGEISLRDNPDVTLDNNQNSGWGMFVDVPAGDLHLKSGASPIDAGSDVGVSTDIDMEARDSTPDIGADEFDGGPPPPEPVCGDGICEVGEDCPSDCETPPDPVCGDGVCEPGEVCEEDCDVPPPACDSCCPEPEECPTCPPAADPDLELVLEDVQSFLDAECAKWRVLPKTDPPRLVLICVE